MSCAEAGAEADALSRLVASFHRELGGLSQLCALRASDTALPAVSGDLTALEASIGQLEDTVRALQAHIAAEKEALPKVRAVLQAAQQQQAHVNFIAAHLPQHLPAAAPQAPPKAHSAAQQPADDCKRSAASPPARERHKPVRFITKAEFEGLSSYTTSRLTLDKVNSGLEDAFTLAAALAKLLAGARANAKLPAPERTRAQMLLVNVAGRAEVKGRPWFTDAERRLASVLKQDKTGRAIVTILRQLRRLQEERVTIKGSVHVIYVLV